MGRRTRFAAVGVAGAVAAAVAVALAAPSAGAAGGTWSGSQANAAAAVQQIAAKPGAQQVAAKQAAAGQACGTGKPGVPGKPAVDPRVAAAAKRFGLSAAKIQQALIDIKMSFAAKGTFPKAGLLDPAVVRMFARSLGISTSKARAVLTFLSAGSGGTAKGTGGKPAPDKFPPEVPAYLAKALHISTSKATALFVQVQKLADADRNSITVKNPAFAKLAASVGVSPQRLIDVLVAMKKALAAGQGDTPTKPGQPKPGQPKPCPTKPGQPSKPGQPKQPVT